MMMSNVILIECVKKNERAKALSFESVFRELFPKSF